MNRIFTKLLLPGMFIFVTGNLFSQNSLSGLISCWKMDETQGSALIDCVNGYNAICNTQLETDENGKAGLSKYFNFTDKATVANNEVYNFAANSSFTIAYWMKFTETQYGLYGGQDHIIISKGDWQTGGPWGALWASGVNGSGKVNFLLSDATGYKIDLEGDNHYNDGLWHHVACVRDESSNKSILFADGIIVDEVTYDYTGSFTNTDPLAFAHLINQSEPEYYYMGSVDEIKIFNRALSSEEISLLMSDIAVVNKTFDPVNTGFTIYPIPASDILNIKLNENIEETYLELISSTGSILKSVIIPANTDMVQISTDDFASGAYYCHIRNNKTDRSSHFLILKK